MASFHIDRGPIMEHQYPGAISGDEHMLAELMLPDQTHVRSQDWTIFFLHKDTSTDEDEESQGSNEDQKEDDNEDEAAGGGQSSEGSEKVDKYEDEEEDTVEGPPLMYVLNLVNTKQDNTAKR